MKKIFLYSIIILSIFVSVLYINDKALAWGSDEDCANGSCTYTCPSSHPVGPIDGQCYEVVDNCPGVSCGSGGVPTTEYTYNKTCPGGETVEWFENCPAQAPSPSPAPAQSGSGSSGHSWDRTPQSSGSTWSWGVGISWNQGYKCWNGTTVNYSWQCPSEYSGCTTNCGGANPAPITCDAALGLYNVNGSCQKRCTDATGSFFYVSPSQQCPSTPAPTTCDAALGLYSINGSCQKRCTDATGSFFYVSPSQQCPSTPAPTTCDAALGLYLVNGKCMKKCTAANNDIFYVDPSNTCPVAPTCPNGQFINNVCSRQCADGSWKPVTDSCPVPPPTFVCWNGTTVNYSWQCPVQPQQYPCWNGQVYYQPGQCPPQITTYTCWNGVVVNFASQCPPQVQYQTCWNGSRIPTTQSCPPQYQTCWNSQIILVTQQCPPRPQICNDCNAPVVQNHSAVTNLATRVSQTSAQCNGVGLIANNINSVGWFEYGETTALEKTTNSGNIGSAASSPFSNLITGLKSNTTYYCRAVIANINGTFKGKIVSFKTLAEVKKSEPKIVYVDKGGKGGNASTSVVKKSKTEFVCSDGSIATAKTVGIADTINSGGKLMQINIEKNVADFAAGSTFNYKLNIKNVADTALTGTEIRFVLPAELSFDKNDLKNATIQNNILTISEAGFNAGEVKTYIIPVKVLNDATVGKTVVSTGYVSYYLPVIGSKLVKDEVSAYMIANITNKVSATDTNLNKDLAAAAGGTFVGAIFPQTLLSWLILFAVILIIVVLIMNIHSWMVMRKKEKEEHIVHHHIA